MGQHDKSHPEAHFTKFKALFLGSPRGHTEGSKLPYAGGWCVSVSSGFTWSICWYSSIVIVTHPRAGIIFPFLPSWCPSVHECFEEVYWCAQKNGDGAVGYVLFWGVVGGIDVGHAREMTRAKNRRQK